MRTRPIWVRVDALTEMQLEAAIASDPAWADIPRDWYKHATPYYPKEDKKLVTLRIVPDVLDWFKRQGRGYQTRINAALRAFVEAHGRKQAFRTAARRVRAAPFSSLPPRARLARASAGSLH